MSQARTAAGRGGLGGPDGQLEVAGPPGGQATPAVISTP
jgi:hypothetical protein